MKIRVYYEDTDAGGIVYHTNYLKYCERARSELFFKQGLTPTDGDASGFVVRNINADFIGMAKLGEMLEVKSELIERKKSSMRLKQSVLREGKPIFEMEIQLLFVRNGRVTRIPEHLFDIIDKG